MGYELDRNAKILSGRRLVSYMKESPPESFNMFFASVNALAKANSFSWEELGTSESELADLRNAWRFQALKKVCQLLEDFPCLFENILESLESSGISLEDCGIDSETLTSLIKVAHKEKARMILDVLKKHPNMYFTFRNELKNSLNISETSLCEFDVSLGDMIELIQTRKVDNLLYEFGVRISSRL